MPVRADAPDRCPLCAEANRCSMAVGLDPSGCWCMHTGVSPEALRAVPPQCRGQRCVCAACAQTGQAPDRPVSWTGASS